ncbi:MAG TPA: hypothetical protein VG843_01315 [Rhizomicrobium sp.]|jgi:hypothetical protein|nr:hypothetical protein [Rhizomicrobium sp.]
MDAAIFAIASGVIVGIATGVLTAWLSLYQFRVQRIWEQREAAYNELLDALIARHNEYDAMFSAWATKSEYPRPQDMAIRDAAEKASELLWRYSLIGPLLVSPEVLAVLEKMHEEMRDIYKHKGEQFVGSVPINAAIKAITLLALADRRSLPKIWPIREKLRHNPRG